MFICIMNKQSKKDFWYNKLQMGRKAIKIYVQLIKEMEYTPKSNFICIFIRNDSRAFICKYIDI
jgi:hypothetical protein